MAGLKIGRMVLGMCSTNCYFVYRESTKEAVFIDPAENGMAIYRTMQEKGFHIAGILLTHGHFDHIMGAEALRGLTGAEIYACEDEKELCENSQYNVSAQVGEACMITPDILVQDGELLTIADMTCKVIATPGHTKGSCCYYFEEDKILISGDTLFCESVGRTDLPSGSMQEIVRSIKEKLFPLPDDVKVYPGHGDTTEIGYEKQNNPFCQ